MAYDLMAESPDPIDWVALRNDVAYGIQGVEFFPIPAGKPGERDALGIRVPFTCLSKASWDELLSVVGKLRSKYRMVIYEMCSAQVLTGWEMGAAHKNFMSSGETVYMVRNMYGTLKPTVLVLRR